MKAEARQRTIQDMDQPALLGPVPAVLGEESTDASLGQGRRRDEAVSGVFATSSSVPRSWQDLYEDHADVVWRTLRRLGLSEFDAKDALQEVFIVAHLRGASYDPQRGSERAWLFGITCNVARSERRRVQRFDRQPSEVELGRSHSSPSLLSEASRRSSDGDACAQSRDLEGALLRALDKLSPEHRVVFEMFEIEGLTSAAIAQEIDVPVGTVYSRLHHARQDLRHALRGQKGPSSSAKGGSHGK
jgi:RNA polymerase sigma-70 factor, ECF subfamily